MAQHVLVSAVLADDPWAIEDAWGGQGKISVMVPSSTGVYFRVTYATSLAEESWATYSLVLGEAGSQALPFEENVSATTRFVRVNRIERVDPMDEDADGMDDVFELQRVFLNAMNGTDAVEDYDFDGWSNLYEYQHATEPGSRDDTGVAATLYANIITGSDAYDGLMETYVNGHGPKQTVDSLFNAAFDGDTLSLAEGDYVVARIDTGSRSLTLRPEGNVVFR